MSWAASTSEPVPPGELVDALVQAYQPQTGYGEVQARQDFEVAVRVASDLALQLANAAEGERRVSASLYGHANPNRAAGDGWALDAIQVRVSL